MTIQRAFERSDNALVEALPAMGKSYGTVAAAAESDVPITFLTGRGRKEQYEQLEAWCEEHGLSHTTLPAFSECLTAAGEYGEAAADQVWTWYKRGASPRDIHAYAELETGEPLGCQQHEGQSCPYSARWRAIDPHEYDVLIGHYSHAHVGSVVQGRAVVVDEFPGAYETVLPDRERVVTTYLQSRPEVPFESFTDLLEGRSDEARRMEALAALPAPSDLEQDGEQAFYDGGHAAAPLAVLTLLRGDNLDNGLERAALGERRVGLHDREAGEIRVLCPPDLRYARSVVALDGTPTPRMWDRALGLKLTHRPVLSGDDERQAYIRDALGLQIVRTTDYVKTYNTAEYVNVERDGALLDAVAAEHGQNPALITTATAEREYAAAGITDQVGARAHYGNVLGSNQFADARVGVVVGSQHYGDRFVQRWAAYDHATVDAVDRSDPTQRGTGLSYGDVGDEILTHMREHETLQAAMRFGRDGDGAVVYVHTNTLPDWVPVAGEGRVLSTRSEGERQVLAALTELDTPRTADIVAHEAVDIGTRQVQHVLASFADREILIRQRAPDDGRAFVWHADGLHRVSEYGEVELATVSLDDLTDDEVDELARMETYYTWDFGSHDDSCARPAGRPSTAGSNGGVAAPDGHREGDGATD
jgi:hypothetical protein